MSEGTQTSRDETGAPGVSPVVVGVQRLASAADLPYPRHATPGASGVDLCAAIDAPLVVRRGEVALVPTGLRLAIPAGWEGQVRARSGLALRHGIALVNAPGTIDSDYRGEIGVVLTTLLDEPFTIERGMRIAQLVICPVARVRFEIASGLADTDRGSGGFGHTGLGGQTGV